MVDSNRQSIPPEKSPHTGAVLDVHSVDSYLLGAFIEPNVVSLFRSLIQNDYEKWAPLIQNSMLALLEIGTILVSRGQTPAARLLGLELARVRSPLLSSLSSPVSRHKTEQVHTFPTRDSTGVGRRRLLTYCLVRFATPVIYGAWKEWAVKRRLELETILTSDEAASSHAILSPQHRRRLVGLQRQVLVADAVIAAIGRLAPILNLMSLFSCWIGVSNAPNLSMLATGLTYRTLVTPDSSDHRRLHVTYAHNRWLGEQTMEALKMLILTSCMRSRRVWTPVLRSNIVDPLIVWWQWIQGRLAPNRQTLVTLDKCPLCQHVPSTTTVQTNCGHIYCYTCLYYEEQKASLADKHGVYCKVCRHQITKATIRTI